MSYTYDMTKEMYLIIAIIDDCIAFKFMTHKTML